MLRTVKAFSANTVSVINIAYNQIDNVNVCKNEIDCNIFCSLMVRYKFRLPCIKK